MIQYYYNGVHVTDSEYELLVRLGIVDETKAEYLILEDVITDKYEESYHNTEEEVGINPSSPSSNSGSWCKDSLTTVPDGFDAHDCNYIKNTILSLATEDRGSSSGALNGGLFVKKLESYRDVSTNVFRSTQTVPSILFLPDFSGSCVHFSFLFNTILQGIKLANSDEYNIVLAPTFDGLPAYTEMRGVTKPFPFYQSDRAYKESDAYQELHSGFIGEMCEYRERHYTKVVNSIIEEYDVKLCICVGDCQGEWMYRILSKIDKVDKVLWLDPASTLEGEKPMNNSKLFYQSNVNSVTAFCEALRRASFL